MKRIIVISILAFFLFACKAEEKPAPSPDSGTKDVPKPVSRMKVPKQMRHCTPCHTLKKGEKHKIGPNLFDIVGKEVGTSPGFKYSREYKEGKWLWTRENLDLLINKKYGTLQEAVRKLTGDSKARTKMKFYGASDEDSQIILDYLESLK